GRSQGAQGHGTAAGVEDRRHARARGRAVRPLADGAPAARKHTAHASVGLRHRLRRGSLHGTRWRVRPIAGRTGGGARSTAARSAGRGDRRGRAALILRDSIAFYPLTAFAAWSVPRFARPPDVLTRREARIDGTRMARGR